MGGWARSVVINGVRLYQPSFKTAEECARALVESYRGELERQRNESKEEREEERDPVDECLRQHPELGAFGREWVREWLYVKERLVEIAETLRRHPWIAEVLRQRRIVNPFLLEVLEATDGSEAYTGIDGTYWCANNGMAREAKLELQVARWERRGERIRPVCRPKGLLAYAERAREYVEVP